MIKESAMVKLQHFKGGEYTLFAEDIRYLPNVTGEENVEEVDRLDATDANDLTKTVTFFSHPESSCVWYEGPEDLGLLVLYINKEFRLWFRTVEDMWAPIDRISYQGPRFKGPRFIRV